MRLKRWLVIVAVFAAWAPVSLGDELAKDRTKYRFQVKRGDLRRGPSTFTLWAIETPDLVKSRPTVDTLAPALNRVAAVGANTVCFDLHGLSANGKTFSQEGVDAVLTALEQITWRRLGAICRVFGPDAPEDEAYRRAAVRAVARALKDETRMVYWIEGPNCADLVAAFNAEAPKLVVAAPEGGAITVVASGPKEASKKPVLLADGILVASPGGRGEIPKSLHLVLPDDPLSYAGVDGTLATFVELQSWTPDNSVLTAEEREAGWIALFDGRSLSGWWVAGRNKEGFEARNGNIEWVRAGASMLLTRNRYDNFILRLEATINDGGNSGIFIRAPRANRASKIGMELQLMGDYGSAPGTHCTGAIYDVLAPTKNASKPAGEWNAFEITADGPHLTLVLNGETVQDINLDENPELKHRLRKGFIGLQDHGNPARFRNIRIKKL